MHVNSYYTYSQFELIGFISEALLYTNGHLCHIVKYSFIYIALLKKICYHNYVIF